jgi:hypothetical protein
MQLFHNAFSPGEIPLNPECLQFNRVSRLRALLSHIEGAAFSETYHQSERGSEAV